MLQVIISPAKQMRVTQDTFSVQGIPPFAHQAARLHQALLSIENIDGADGLQALWNVSDKLLASCMDTLHEFAPVLREADLADSGIARRISPAIMSHHGIQYQSMAPEVMDAKQLAWLQSHLWILSGLYGCVRPFHAVEPYRLEMGAKLAVDDARDLYAFWGDKLARATAPAGSNTTIVNLASVEYAKAVLPHLADDATAVTCLFGEGIRNGKPIQRSTASKKARGSMVRWMAENKLEDASELTAFNIGYRHIPELSDKNTLVFMNAQAGPPFPNTPLLRQAIGLCNLARRAILVGNLNVLYVGYRNARRRFQAPFRQRDIHGRGHIPLIFELDRQCFERLIKRHAFDFLARNRPTAQLQLHKLVARIPVVARRGHRVATSDLHRHDRQGIVGLKLPGSAATTAERPNTKGNHQHGKHRKTNRDQPMVCTVLLGRHVPLRRSI